MVKKDMMVLGAHKVTLDTQDQQGLLEREEDMALKESVVVLDHKVSAMADLYSILIPSLCVKSCIVL